MYFFFFYLLLFVFCHGAMASELVSAIPFDTSLPEHHLREASLLRLSSDVEAVCSILHSTYPNLLVWDPLGPHGLKTINRTVDFEEASANYLSAESAARLPACIFFPANAQQVSSAVMVLNAHPTVRFGLKSGGHNPNPEFSTASGGLLISFRLNSCSVVPNANDQSVLVGAGCKWKDVYSALQPLGKAAVGGRFGDIGVTGFILGGGLSYLSAQYGFACDNVLSFECVLANGTIVTASANSHSDLYFALRGGGNQFAIVTRLKLRTWDVGYKGIVWGGVRAYAAAQQPALLAAIANFTTNSDAHPKAALLPNFNFIGALGPVSLVFFFYDGSLPPTNVFAEFDRLPSLWNDTKQRTYENLHEDVFSGDLKQLRIVIRENTFPNMPLSQMSSFLVKHNTALHQVAESLAESFDLRVLSCEIQPMPRTIVEASWNTGGANALSLAPEHGDRLWIVYHLAWLQPSCDKKCPSSFQKVVESMHDLHNTNFSRIAPTNYKHGNLSIIRKVLFCISYHF
ncbi:hypothetical protein CDD81_4154 [Ophiocordyceps australis]|uniref:FAD-binding PCMH-type domain-containing protein n=1 Tax=Ophiocordyceps australis TaxID=1399860 RepID=A0A2C5XR47_9HYPO|nr:hypothetical protein CDD81_4154 [Ophiocordyceps australis]